MMDQPQPNQKGPSFKEQLSILPRIKMTVFSLAAQMITSINYCDRIVRLEQSSIITGITLQFLETVVMFIHFSIIYLVY